MAREYKDSGIEWIGQIPKEWEVCRLKNITTCLDYRRVPLEASMRKRGPYPYWGAGSIMDYVDNYIYDEELVLLGEDGAPFFDKTRDVAFYVNEKVWVNNHIHTLMPKPSLNAKYLTHYLNTVDYKTYINGSILNKLTQTNMNEINCILPNVLEQQKIADYLDKICGEVDEMVALQETMIEELKAYKQSVITEAVTKGLNPNAPMRNSGIDWIGEMPKHWQVIKMRRCVDSIGDVDHYMPDSIETGIPYIMTRDLADRTSMINMDQCKQISYEDYVNLSRKISIEKNDVIFARYATIGNVCFVDTDADMVVSYSCVIIKPLPTLFGLYLFYYLKSKTFEEEVLQFVNTNIQGNVGIDSLYKTKMMMPPLVEQRAIATYLDTKCSEIDSLIALKQAKIEELKEYKKSVIYEYVTGKKEVV